MKKQQDISLYLVYLYYNHMALKKICALTMARNDEFFLRRWVSYYGKELGMENLYVFLDGKDQPLPDWCPGVHVTACEKIQGKVVDLDRRRLEFLSDQAGILFSEYDMVIGTDADEFLIADPRLGVGLAEYLSASGCSSSLSGLGIDVGQNMSCEGAIDSSEPFLNQRRYALIGTRYTKPSVIARPLRWGSGFHRIKGHDFHIAKGLYLFHFGYLDMKRIEERFNDKDRIAGGWSRHLAKRARTIRLVSRKKARDWDKWTSAARILQTFIRPPYAWNKPAMLNMEIVVKIPDRFKNIV